MELKLTHLMDGEVIETIANSQSMKDIWIAAEKWKIKNKNRFKIEKYSRKLFKKNEKKLIVDFGDYSYFFLIDGFDDYEKEVNDV